LTNVQVLFLHGDAVVNKVLKNGAFKNFKNLNSFKLCLNAKEIKIEEDAFDGLDQLNELRLFFIGNEKHPLMLDSRSFKSLINLKILYISECRIELVNGQWRLFLYVSKNCGSMPILYKYLYYTSSIPALPELLAEILHF
jgi:hypothetical protein